MMPTTRMRWRKAQDGSGELEECTSSPHPPGRRADRLVDWDISFPDDEREANPASYNFFKAAQDWAAKRTGGVAAGGGLSYDLPSDSDDEDDDNDAEEEDQDARDAEDGVGVDAAEDAMEEDE